MTTIAARDTTIEGHEAHREIVYVHFDELDPMGVLHNSRYAILLERALSAYWARLGHSFVDGRPTSPDTVHAVREFSISYLAPIRSVGPVDVVFWVDALGETSLVYGFEFRSGTTVYATGHRTIVRLDPVTFRPSPWTPQVRQIAEALRRSC